MADPKFSLDPSDYEDVEIDDPDNPEWTEEDFSEARPFREAFPDVSLEHGLRTVALDLSPNTIAAFAVEGEDWRERMAEVLTQAARAKRVA